MPDFIIYGLPYIFSTLFTCMVPGAAIEYNFDLT